MSPADITSLDRIQTQEILVAPDESNQKGGSEEERLETQPKRDGSG